MSARATAVAALLAASCVGTVDGTTGETATADPGMRAESTQASNSTGGRGGGAAGKSGTSGPGPLPASCPQRDPGPSPLRRLTNWEYDNTIRDVLGDTSRPASATFPADNKVAVFDNDVSSQVVSGLLAQDYADAAERLAAAAWPSVAMRLSCNAAAGDMACGAKFIETWGKRAWRRPLDAQEKAAITDLFGATMASAGFAAAIQRVMQAMLQSPQFLYRLEIGQPVPGTALVALTPWETASRLSYLLWGSMPDDALMAAADAGQLGTKEQLASQARRMLDSADGQRRTRAVVDLFHDQWLELGSLQQLDKDGKLFPGFTTVRPLLRQETEAFVESIVWDPAATLEHLLTAPFTMANAKLADFYGVTANRPTGDAFQRVDWTPGQRGGLLTLGAFMATHAKADQTYPPGRGKFVRENLLCQPLPPPVANVMAPPLDPKLTGRERWEAHARQPCAAACHQLMEPIGLGFESLDAVGRYRTMENGKPIDASGELTATDVDGKFAGPVELSKRLASSDAVSACFVTQWFDFAYGRLAGPGDECNVGALQAAFKAGGGNIHELLVALTQSDAFMYRRAGGAQ